MAGQIILPRQLPPATEVFPDAQLVVDTGTAVERATPQQIVDASTVMAVDVQMPGGGSVEQAITEAKSVTDGVSAFGKTLIDDVDAAAARQTLDVVHTTGSYDNTTGRVVRLSSSGFMGIGNITIAPTDISVLDNSIVPGWYHVSTGTSGRPVGINFAFMQHSRRSSGGGEVQVLVAQDPLPLAGTIYTRSRGSTGWSDWIVGGELTDFDTIAQAQAKWFAAETKELSISGTRYKAVADSNTSAGPGQFTTGGSFGSVLRRRWQMSEPLVTPALFASLQDFFNFLPTEVRKHMPTGTYTIDGPVSIPDETHCTAAVGASIRPSYIQAGAGSTTTRATAYITVGNNVTMDNISVHVNSSLAIATTGPGGALQVSQASKAIEFVGSNCVFRSIRVTSGAYNMCIRVSDVEGDEGDTPTTSYNYDRFGAVVLGGSNNYLGKVYVDNWRVGFVADDPSVTSGVPNSNGNFVETIDVRRISCGIKMRRTRDLRIMSARVDTIPYLQQNRSWNVNGLLKGENCMLWGGAQNCYVGYAELYNSLEHNVRFGHGAETANLNNEYGRVVSIAAYGCGFKIDDADGYRTKGVKVGSLYVEDAGRDAEARPFDTPGAPYSNKESLAIRNCDGAEIRNYTCRKRNFPYSGNIAVFIEKSTNVQVEIEECSDAYRAGVLLAINGSTQSGGPHNMNNVKVEGTVRNCPVGFLFRPVTNLGTCNKVDINLNLYECPIGYEVEGRPNGTNFLAGPFRINGKSRDNSTYLKRIHESVAQDNNMRDGIEILGGFTVNPASVPANSYGAKQTFNIPGARIGDFVDVTFKAALSVPFFWQGIVTSNDVIDGSGVNTSPATVDVMAINTSSAAVDAPSAEMLIKIRPQRAN